MKILQFGNYPIQKPLHGGQKRVRAIHNEFKKRGHEVRHCGVYFSSLYPAPLRGPDDVTLDSEDLNARLKHQPVLEDLLTAVAPDFEPAVQEKIRALIESFRPEVIQMEQCFVWPIVKAALRESGHRCAIIHSSQNVEAEMKLGIYRENNLPDPEKHAALVSAIEQDLTASASLTLAVSPGDAAKWAELGAKTILAANSNELATPSPATLARWRKLRDENRRLFLFVGSDHPPNRNGFFNLLGTSLAYLPPGVKIVICGGVGRAIQSAGFFEGVLAQVNRSRSDFHFHPSDEDLGALYGIVDAVLLPIDSGGGSNLKTVEALVSGKPILATSFAFRAFDEFTKDAGVTIADNQSSFQTALQKLASAETIPAVPERDTSALTWSACLSAYAKALEGDVPAGNPAESDTAAALSAFAAEARSWNIPPPEVKPDTNANHEATQHYKKLIRENPEGSSSFMPALLFRAMRGPAFVFHAFRKAIGRRPTEQEYIYYYYAFKKNRNRAKFFKHIYWSELNYRRNAEKYRFTGS